jgi:hypothetical protein
MLQHLAFQFPIVTFAAIIEWQYFMVIAITVPIIAVMHFASLQWTTDPIIVGITTVATMHQHY